ncbi:MAG: hypothetical protein Q8M08_01040 [Bacteroidales bacterium]|nr:hypothetical protein [Bacteroidales bacterium]
MKKLIICISALSLISGSDSSLTAQTPQYYNYNTPGTANLFPFNVSTGKDVQLLYHPGDFNQPTAAPAGNILSIAFRIYGNLGPFTYSDFTIKLGQSNIGHL